MASGSPRDFHQRWLSLQPPLRPHPDVAALVGTLLPQGDRPVLLLGVTPELATVPKRTLAVDWDAQMLEVAWPGDAAHRRAVLGDWRQLPIASGSVAAAIGDGSISILRFPDEAVLLFEQLRLAIAPGGRAIIRCFATPEPAETLTEVCEGAFSGRLTFHDFKQRLNIATAVEAGTVNISCPELLASFDRLFPDRQALSDAAGWSLEQIAEIDAYRTSRYVHCYPSRSQLMTVVPGWMASASFVETSGYPLAERCPLLVLDFP